MWINNCTKSSKNQSLCIFAAYKLLFGCKKSVSFHFIFCLNTYFIRQPLIHMISAPLPQFLPALWPDLSLWDLARCVLEWQSARPHIEARRVG